MNWCKMCDASNYWEFNGKKDTFEFCEKHKKSNTIWKKIADKYPDSPRAIFNDTITYSKMFLDNVEEDYDTSPEYLIEKLERLQQNLKALLFVVKNV